MLDQQLVAHIRTQLAFGKSKEDIVKELAGISDSDIAEAFTAAGVMPPMEAAPSESMYAQSSVGQTQSIGKVRSLILYGAVAFAVIVMTAGVSYAYIQKLWFFGGAPYSEDNLVSGILASFADIDSARYTLSGTLAVVDRDADAVPFTLKLSNEAELRQQYQNDSLRANDVRTILSTLSRDYAVGGIPYPATLPKTIQSRRIMPPAPLVTTDPKTSVPYAYVRTNDGKDFTLSVTFETRAALRALKQGFPSYGDAPVISGNTVTYTSASRTPYLPPELPQPLIVELSEMARMLPPDIQARIAVSAASDWSGGESAEWTLNLDAEGDFGDLAYKINADLLKKSNVYYFRINNLPSIFSGFLPVMKKGEWISVDPKESNDETKRYSLSSTLTDIEEGYKEARTEAASFMREVARIADEEKLLHLKTSPVRETVGDRSLYRYELEFRKEAVVPFYRRMLDAALQYEHISKAEFLNDDGLLEYLESEEFLQMFDYISKNTSFVIWVDKEGRLGAMEYSMRLVPPDTAIQLEGKQAVATIRLALSELNEEIIIEAPEDAKTFTEFSKEMDANQSSARSKGAAASVKANLNNARAQASLVYNETKSYGAAAFTLGVCVKKSGTLFEDDGLFKMIDAASEAAGGAPLMCVSTKTAYAISAPLPGSDGYSWCVDSTGASQQILGVIKGTSCR